MPPLNGFSATLPTDVILESGVLYINSVNPFGVSKGGLAFDPSTEWENMDFDGKTFPVKGLDRKTGGVPKISGTIIELSTTRMTTIEPGSTQAGAAADVTVSPKGAGDFLAAGDYLTNVRVAYRRGNGKFAIVKFPNALLTKYSVKGVSKGQAEVAIEIEARAADASGAAPYEVHLADAVGGP